MEDVKQRKQKSPAQANATKKKYHCFYLEMSPLSCLFCFPTFRFRYFYHVHHFVLCIRRWYFSKTKYVCFKGRSLTDSPSFVGMVTGSLNRKKCQLITSHFFTCHGTGDCHVTSRWSTKAKDL